MKKYISFYGMERYNDNTLKDTEMLKWINENVENNNMHYVIYAAKKPGYLSAISLDEEQQVVFKLKFGI